MVFGGNATAVVAELVADSALDSKVFLRKAFDFLAEDYRSFK